MRPDDLPSSAPGPGWPITAVSCVTSLHSGRSDSWSMPSRRSPASRPYSLIKGYRHHGPERQCVITPAPHEFIRRFLIHVLPRGFHRILHCGLLASSARKAGNARARELLAVAPPPEPVEVPEPLDPLPPCPCCGGQMTIIEIFGRWRQPRAPPQAAAPTGIVPS